MANELSLSDANALASLLSAKTNSLNSALYGSDHLNKVSGIEGMNAFQTKANSQYALFEENSDIFGIKITDETNTPTIRYFAFKEISKEEAMQQISPYLMKGELDSFKADILNSIRSEMTSFKEEILNAQQYIRNKSEPNIVLSSNSGSWPESGR